MRIRRRGRREGTRCPYCHDDLGRDGLVRCRSCGAHYHEDCVARCVGLGCQGVLEPAPPPGLGRLLQPGPLLLAGALSALMLAELAIKAQRQPSLFELAVIGGGTLVAVCLGAALVLGLREASKTMYRPRYRSERLRQARPSESPWEDRPSARLVADLGGAPPSGLRPPRPPARPASPEGPDPEDARLRQIETLRRRRQRPGLGRTI